MHHSTSFGGFDEERPCFQAIGRTTIEVVLETKIIDYGILVAVVTSDGAGMFKLAEARPAKVWELSSL